MWKLNKMGPIKCNTQWLVHCKSSVDVGCSNFCCLCHLAVSSLSTGVCGPGPWTAPLRTARCRGANTRVRHLQVRSCGSESNRPGLKSHPCHYPGQLSDSLTDFVSSLNKNEWSHSLFGVSVRVKMGLGTTPGTQHSALAQEVCAVAAALPVPKPSSLLPRTSWSGFHPEGSWILEPPSPTPPRGALFPHFHQLLDQGVMWLKHLRRRESSFFFF